MDNEVGEKGCRHLSKAGWGKLEEIYIGHCSLTQTIIKLGIGAAGTSAGETGEKWKELAWVIIKIFQTVVKCGRRGAGRWPSGRGTSSGSTVYL